MAFFVSPYLVTFQQLFKIIFMKKYLLYLLAISLVFNISCSDDGDGGGGSDYEFLDQNAQGKINGKDFALVLGKGEMDPFDETRLSITLWSESFTDACGFNFGQEVSSFFTVPMQVGLYELKLDLTDFEGSQTVTLFDPDGTLNIICSDGAVEILSITETKVTGKIHAYYTGDKLENDINGNFEVTYCEPL